MFGSGEEIWIPVSGYEGLYEVSSLGHVKSLRILTLHRNGVPFSVEEGVLHPSLDRDGYPVVILCKNDMEWIQRVHRLMMRAFRGPRPEGVVTRHENGCRIDNRLDNLIYGTPKENGEDKARHKTVSGENHPGAKFTNDQIREIRRRLATGKHGIVVQLSKEYGVTHAMISAIKNNKNWVDVQADGVDIRCLRKERLTVPVVKQIKRELAVGGWGITSRLSKKYGVTQQMISCIKTGKAWAHVTLDENPSND
jgi:NUMOD4 motif/HNH endonuclease